MDYDTAQTYTRGVFDQLRAAVADGDPDAAARITDQVDADGYGHAAKVIDAGLATTTLGEHLAD